MSLTIGRTTSASSKNVVVSDQSMTETLKRRPSCADCSSSIFVNAHGPAMHEILALRNSFPSPASRDVEAFAALHLPSGEHGGRRTQGTFPALSTWKVLTAFPTFASVVALTEYRIRAFATVICGLRSSTRVP